MIRRFQQVTANIYRGSCPTVEDLVKLKQNFGIKKIISLDQDCGNNIEKACKQLGLKQVKIYLDGSKSSVLNLLNYNIKSLLDDGGPTYIHCLRGADRTGFLVALYQVKYLGINPQEAIRQAKVLDFGGGIDPEFMKLLEDLILNAKSNNKDLKKDVKEFNKPIDITNVHNYKKDNKNLNDNNSIDDDYNGDIVSNTRMPASDPRESYLDTAHQSSISPYQSATKQAPFDSVYDESYGRDGTRESYQQDKLNNTSNDKIDMNSSPNSSALPQNGLFVNNLGLGMATVNNISGFYYD